MGRVNNRLDLDTAIELKAAAACVIGLLNPKKSSVSPDEVLRKSIERLKYKLRYYKQPEDYDIAVESFLWGELLGLAKGLTDAEQGDIRLKLRAFAKDFWREYGNRNNLRV